MYSVCLSGYAIEHLLSRADCKQICMKRASLHRGGEQRVVKTHRMPYLAGLLLQIRH